MSDLASALSQALRATQRQKYYRLRVPLGGTSDAQIRSVLNLGTKGIGRESLSSNQLENRANVRYSGAGRYKRRRTTYPSRSRRVRGRGGYWMQKLFGAKPGGFWDRAGDLASSAAGQLMPGFSAIRGGAEAAHRALKGSGMYMGSGAYQSNSLVDEGAAVPGFNDVPDGNSVCISHREYIGDIYGPENGNFTNVIYNINPGLERTFPWLSQIACNYDEYTIQQLMFTYRPTVTDFAAASGQQGQVIMATQYNANDQPFTDKRVMMQYDGAMSSKVSVEQVHGVECDPRKLSGDQGKYVRNRPVLEDQDINTYDHGKFNIAIADIPSTYVNQSLGELWVSYTIELRKPKFYANKGLAITKDIFAQTANQSTVTKQDNPFGFITQDGRIYGQQNSLQSLLDINDLSTPLLVPAGSPQLSIDAGCLTDTAPASGTQIWAYRITLPAYWAGNLEINFNQNMDNVSPLQPVIYRMYTSGNISAINDLFSYSTSGSGPNMSGYTFATTALTKDSLGQFGTSNIVTLTQLWHLRVQESSNGINNCLYFVCQTPDGVNCQISKTFANLLTLTEYNTGLNYKVDGNNDDIILVDKNGNPVQPF